MRTPTDHAIIPLTRTPEREKAYQWLAPQFDYHFVTVTRAEVVPPRSLDDAKHLAIGVLRGNPMDAMLPRMGFTNIKPGTSESLLARQLQVNLIDAWVVADLVARDTYKKAGGNPDEVRFGPRIGEPMRIYPGASLEFPMDYSKQIAEAVNRLRNTGQLTVF